MENISDIFTKTVKLDYEDLDELLIAIRTAIDYELVGVLSDNIIEDVMDEIESQIEDEVIEDEDAEYKVGDRVISIKGVPKSLDYILFSLS